MVASCELHPDGRCRFMIDVWRELFTLDVPISMWRTAARIHLICRVPCAADRTDLSPLEMYTMARPRRMA